MAFYCTVLLFKGDHQINLQVMEKTALIKTAKRYGFNKNPNIELYSAIFINELCGFASYNFYYHGDS